MNGRTAIVGGLAVAVLASSVAVAQTVADPNGIPLKPWVEFLEPYVAIFLGTVVTALAGIVVTKMNQWFNVSIDATQVARLKSAAATAAGGLIAAAEDNLKTKTITVNNPAVVKAANDIISRLPDTAKSVGATPEAVGAMITGEVGKLQAGQITPEPLTANR